MQEYFMLEAINQAKIAESYDEVPIGCVIVYNGEIIAKGYNYKENDQNPLLHAELMAIEQACKVIGSWRLIDCDLYVTLEPCPMCSGAIVQARMRNVYYGAYDYKCGCGGTNYNLMNDEKFNHRCNVYG